jgi:hypothetical protein
MAQDTYVSIVAFVKDIGQLPFNEADSDRAPIAHKMDHIKSFVRDYRVQRYKECFANEIAALEADHIPDEQRKKKKEQLEALIELYGDPLNYQICVKPSGDNVYINNAKWRGRVIANDSGAIIYYHPDLGQLESLVVVNHEYSHLLLHVPFITAFAAITDEKEESEATYLAERLQWDYSQMMALAGYNNLPYLAGNKAGLRKRILAIQEQYDTKHIDGFPSEGDGYLP